jgi:hypothetical protein
VPVTELVLRRLLPMAADGLERWGVDAADRDRLLAIIEGRCVSGRNGAEWQVGATRTLNLRTEEGQSIEALRTMLAEYRERMHSNVPVHEWPLPGAVPGQRAPESA